MPAGNKSLQNPIVENAGLLFLALLPAAVWLANAGVLGNVSGDVDTWFYFGHFMGLGKYDVSNIPGRDYYETRLPFILPGFIVFQALPLAWAKIAFAYLVYGVTISALFYTLSAHLPRRAAILVLMLLASDIYFMRTVSWNYVDAGVLVYQALAFASLTAARRSALKLLWVGISAFCFVCSVFCHLGAVLSVLPIAAYAWVLLDLAKQPWKGALSIVGAAVAGAVLCQIVFGLLNIWINDGNFFFLWLLYKIAKGETHSSQVGAQSPRELVQYYGWLTVPFAIWIASGIALLAGLFRRVKLERFQTTMLLMAFGTCSLLYLLDQIHFSYYLARAGLYVSLYLVICYLGVAALFMRAPQPSASATLAIGSAFLLALLVRLHYGGGTIPWLPSIGDVWIAGVALGLLLALAFFLPGKGWKAAILCLAAVLTLYITWQFSDTRDAYTAFMVVREMAGNELPRIWARQDDPLYKNVILPVTSSFTERGWWIRGENFPDDPPDALSNDSVFVVSSRLRSVEQAEKLAAPHVTRMKLVQSRLLHLSQGDLWIGQFRVWSAMGSLGMVSPKLLQEGRLPAADLSSLSGTVKNGARVATEGNTGTLMYGPYISLAPGRYRFTIVYGPSDGKQKWDICSLQKDGIKTIVHGDFPPTNGQDGRITQILQFDKKVSSLEIRAFYSGTGHLTVRFIGVKPLMAQTRHPGA